MALLNTMQLPNTLAFHPPVQTNSVFDQKFLNRRPSCRVMVVDTDQKYFKNPIDLIAEQVPEGYWIVTNSQIMTHGVGDTCDQGVSDFIDMLFDYFKELLETEAALAPNLQNQLNYLRAVLNEENII
ncbi:hypothetical protein IMZ68_04685 [Candidatus Bathyarchaeota archaeon]|nr:hypothetical protein [Candidatus Bathyarchaeota archaeon]